MKDSNAIIKSWESKPSLHILGITLYNVISVNSCGISLRRLKLCYLNLRNASVLKPPRQTRGNGARIKTKYLEVTCAFESTKKTFGNFLWVSVTEFDKKKKQNNNCDGEGGLT